MAKPIILHIYSRPRIEDSAAIVRYFGYAKGGVSIGHDYNLSHHEKVDVIHMKYDSPAIGILDTLGFHYVILSDYHHANHLGLFYNLTHEVKPGRVLTVS